MHRILSLISGMAILLFAAGCIETHMLVNVRPDGSGTVRETLKMNAMVLEPFMELARSMGEQQEGEDGVAAEPPPTEPPVGEFFTEQQIRDRAATYGPGVTYVSHEMLTEGEKRGYVAEYAFRDINTLLVDSNPGAAMPTLPGTSDISEGEGAGDEKDFVAFIFTKGSPARLLIRPPAMNKQDETATASDQAEPVSEETTADAQNVEVDSIAIQENLEQMKRIFLDMRISVVVNVEGHIQSSNAMFRDGNAITILDIDFSKLMENEEALKQLEAMEDMDPALMKELMMRIPGIRFEPSDEVEILFE